MAGASKKLLRDLPTEEEIFCMVRQLKGQNHQTIALMGAAYMDHALETLLASKFRPLKKEDHNKLFSASRDGYLSGTDGKIRVAYALGLFGPHCYDDMLLINDIRNVFAHSLHRVDFTNSLIVKDCQNLRMVANIPESRLLKAPMPDNHVDLFIRTVRDIHLGIGAYVYTPERMRDKTWMEYRDYEIISLP
jgi:hypothetical protein